MMNCPCCAILLRAEDGPHVVCPRGHRFYVEMDHADHHLSLQLVADPLRNAGVAVGHQFYRSPATAQA